jgi:hypothetical protein
MVTTQVEEPVAQAQAGAGPQPSPNAADAAREAWERFLQARAREAASRPLGRWRDEEAL